MITITIAFGLLSFAGLGLKLLIKPTPVDSQLPLDAPSITSRQQNDTLASREWWSNKRIKYNLGLVIAGVTAFFAYAILGGFLIAPYDNRFEITLFTILFQGIGYLFMMLVANLFYNLGYFVDKKYNPKNNESYRQKLFNLGFWLSVGLPFLIPTLVIVEYFIRFN